MTIAQLSVESESLWIPLPTIPETALACVQGYHVIRHVVHDLLSICLQCGDLRLKGNHEKFIR
jgi:hypothetical protein